MKQFRNYLLIALFVFFSGALYSQGNNYADGFVVLSSGDTLIGKIKKESSFAHAEYVMFRQADADSPRKYLPEELLSYYFEDSNYYESFSVPFASSTSTELSYRRLFLKKMVDGDVELFKLEYRIRETPSYVYDYQTKFYFIRLSDDETLTDLQENDYRFKIEQFFEGLYCNPEEIAGYNDPGLTNLVIAYSRCANYDVEAIYKQPTLDKINWGVSFGVASTEVSIENSRIRDFAVENTFGYEFNAFLQSSFNDFLSGRIGLKYKSREHEGRKSETVSEFYVNAGEVLELQSSVEITQLVIPAHLLISPFNGKLSPYLVAGADVGFSLGNSYFFDETRFVRIDGGDNLVVNRVTPFAPDEINAFELGWVIGLGIDVDLRPNQSIFLEVQYSNNSSNNSRESPLFILQKGFTLLVGYKF